MLFSRGIIATAFLESVRLYQFYGPVNMKHIKVIRNQRKGGNRNETILEAVAWQNY